jgi:hypothetical protein
MRLPENVHLPKNRIGCEIIRTEMIGLGLRCRGRPFGRLGFRQIVLDIFGDGFLDLAEFLAGRNTRPDRHLDDLARVSHHEYACADADQKGGDDSTHALLPC